jgi:hypothetical protein
MSLVLLWFVRLLQLGPNGYGFVILAVGYLISHPELIAKVHKCLVACHWLTRCINGSDWLAVVY